MKTKRKALALALCAVLLVVTSVLGTMAYLTDTDKAINTFTVGKVYIDLDEAKVNKDGTYVTDHDNRVKENEYHLIPGHLYYKDPTVTVEEGSEESYVRAFVELSYSSQLDAIFGEDGVDLTTIFKGYDPANWALVGNVENEKANTRTYEFRYVGEENRGTKAGTVKKAEAGDIVLDDIFESFTVPGEITKEQLATLVTYKVDPTTQEQTTEIESQFTITVTAQAIQADGFDDAEAAWTAWVD